MAAGIYSAGSVTSKNALWVAISSTVAAICLFTSVMNREAGAQVDTGALESSVDAIVQTASNAVGEQEAAAQGFVDSLANSAGSIHDTAFGTTKTVRVFVPPQIIGFKEHRIDVPFGPDIVIRIPIISPPHFEDREVGVPGNCDRIDEAVNGPGDQGGDDVGPPAPPFPFPFPFPPPFPFPGKI